MCVGRSPSGNHIATSLRTNSVVSASKTINFIVPFDVSNQQPKIQKTTQESIEDEFKDDILAVATRYTKEILHSLNQWYYKKFLGSVAYKILFHTTQPAHLLTALSVLWIAYLMLPSKSQSPISPMWTLVYLGSFATHFGAQIWMTFVSGLALYFNLPRHTFGNIQKVLFPKYFLMNATLSLVTLAIFLRTKNHELNTAENTIQACGMSVCFLVELVVRLYLTPPLLDLMSQKNVIEKGAGIGMEVGKLNLGTLKTCSRYLIIHRRFRKIHMTIASLNIVAMACTMLHLYYLSHKLCTI